MSDRNILLTLIGIIVIVFIIIGIFGIVNMSKNSPKMQTYYDEVIVPKVDAIEKGEIKGKYSSNEMNSEYINCSQEDRDYIDMMIDNVFEMISRRDSQNLEKHLHYSYKYYRFRKEDSLKKYLDEVFDESIAVKVKDFKLRSNNLFINICEVGSDDIYQTILVRDYKSKESYTIYFGDYGYAQGIAVSFPNDSKVYIDSTRLFFYGDGASLVFYAYNYNKTKVLLDFSGTTLYTKNAKGSKTCAMISDSKVEIEPDTYEQFEIKFEPLYGTLDKVNAKFSINGKNYESVSSVAYKSDDDDE